MQDVVSSNVYTDVEMNDDNEDEPFVYNVTCIKNRYDVLRNHDGCNDNVSMSNKVGSEHHSKFTASFSNRKAYKCKTQKGWGQKCGFPGDRQMLASGGRQGKRTQVLHDGCKGRQKRSVMSMESDSTADQAGHGTLSWSTPNGKIVSHAL